MKRNLRKLLSNTLHKHMLRSMHVVRWVLGFPTVMYINGKFTIKGPPYCYQIFLSILVIYHRINLARTAHQSISQTYKIVDVMYEVVRTTEVVCAMMCWFIYSKRRTKDVLEFQNNLIDVHRLLSKQWKNRIEKHKLFSYIYLIITLLYIVIEIIWKKSYYRCLQALKILAMDVTFLRFMEEMGDCIRCMQVLNRRLFDKRPIVDREKVDYKNCRVFILNCINVPVEDVENIAIAEAYEKIKNNLLIATKAFAFPVSK